MNHYHVVYQTPAGDRVGRVVSAADMDEAEERAKHDILELDAYVLLEWNDLTLVTASLLEICETCGGFRKVASPQGMGFVNNDVVH